MKLGENIEDMMDEHFGVWYVKAQKLVAYDNFRTETYREICSKRILDTYFHEKISRTIGEIALQLRL